MDSTDLEEDFLRRDLTLWQCKRRAVCTPLCPQCTHTNRKAKSERRCCTILSSTYLAMGMLNTLAGLLLLIWTLESVAGEPKFDYLVFAQQWPTSICVDEQLTHKHVCKFNRNVTSWTIHGVWPTKAGTFGPNFCNKTEKFDPAKLSAILTELEKYWPNLYTDTPLTGLWKHEWLKHGTCAHSIFDMATELKYFSKGLALNRDVNLLQFLSKSGVVPKPSYTYQLVEVVKALQKALGGATPQIQCIYDKESKMQYIAQVEVCLSKQFKPTDCVHVVADLELRDSMLADPVRRAQLYDDKDDTYTVVSREGGLGLSGVQPCSDTESVAYPPLH